MCTSTWVQMKPHTVVIHSIRTFEGSIFVPYEYECSFLHFWQLIINKCCVVFYLFYLDTSIAALLTTSQIPYKKGKAHTVCFPLSLNKRWRLKETSAEILSILLVNNGKLEFNGVGYIGLPQHPHFALDKINGAPWQICTVFSIFKFLVSKGIIR